MTNTPQWREEFDKQFPWAKRYMSLPPLFSAKGVIKEPSIIHRGDSELISFIETQIAQAREEMKMKCLFICKQEIAYHGASYDERDLIVCGRISNSISSL